MDFINEVIEADDRLYSDFINCCLFFTSDQIIFDGKEIIGNDIWDTSVITDHLVENHANKNIIKNIFETICMYEKSIPTSGICFIKDALSKNVKTYSPSIRTRSSFVFNQVNKYIKCEETKAIFKSIKKYGNPSLSISFAREPTAQPIIKFSNLPSVKLKVAEGFVPKTNKFSNCNFLMIDGAMSSTSELTVLLNKSFEEKDKTYFLVCKSFNSEILYTIKENYDRNLVNIIPVEYGFDLESINSLADLVSVVGGLPVSPSLGDSVSSFNYERLGKCDECKFYNNTFVIKSNINNINHRKNIAKKIELSTEEAEKELLVRRLSGLSSNSCKIILPNSKSYNMVERNIKYSTLLLKEMTQNYIVECKFGKQKFYISDNAYKIQPEIKSKIKNLLKTKIFLPRSNHG